MEKKKRFIAVVMMALFLVMAGTSVVCALEKVNINTASADQLQVLKNVGEKTALAIISYRDAHNGFKAPEDIKQVKGIGDKTFEANKALIVVKDE